jgi:hypothetical protein
MDGLGALWKTHIDPRWLFPNHSCASAKPARAAPQLSRRASCA